MSCTHGCKGAPAASSLCLARSLPCIPLCSASKERVFHKWASPSFARGGWAYRQQEQCTAKTQWALQTQVPFRYDPGVATGFPRGKERKLDSCMLGISEILRMKMIKWNKIKKHIRPSLTDLFHLLGRVSHWASGRFWVREDSMRRLKFAATNVTVSLCKAELSGKVSVQPVATDTVSRRQKQWIFCLSALYSVQPLCE